MCVWVWVWECEEYKFSVLITNTITKVQSE